MDIGLCLSLSLSLSFFLFVVLSLSLSLSMSLCLSKAYIGRWIDLDTYIYMYRAAIVWPEVLCRTHVLPSRAYQKYCQWLRWQLEPLSWVGIRDPPVLKCFHSTDLRGPQSLDIETPFRPRYIFCSYRRPLET